MINPRSRGAFTIKELSVWANVGRTTLYAEIAAGRLEAIKVRNRTLVRVSAAEEWLNACPRICRAPRKARTQIDERRKQEVEPDCDTSRKSPTNASHRSNVGLDVGFLTV